MKALLKRILSPPRTSAARISVTGRREDAYVIAANDHGLYCVPMKAAHRPACQAILSGKVWERNTIRSICDHADGDVVHAGTFFGDFLPILSRSFEQVWAFEPNPDSFKCAEITLRLNDITNVRLVNGGLGRAEGTASLRTTKEDGTYLGGGSFIEEGSGDTRIFAIDAVVPRDRRIGAIHLDVERFEGEALAGALETIRRWRPTIIVETVPADSDAFVAMKEMGYRPVEQIDGNVIYKAQSE